MTTAAACVSAPENLLGYTRHQLNALASGLKHGGRTDRLFSTKVLKAIHRHGETNVAAVESLNKTIRAYLSAARQSGCVRLPRIAHQAISADGSRKWLAQLDDGERVEMVFIPQGDRGTLCVSSQAGCPLNCAFCATARGGFRRNLSAAEIVAQLWLATHRLLQTQRVTNVVFMGMGEPLLNVDAVINAIRIMLDDCAYGLGERHITVSTAGHVAGMRALGERLPVNLSVSLHAPDDALRTRLMPINRKYPLARLLEACREYAERANGFVTFEYSLLRGVNDTPAHARAVAALLADVPCKINLLSFNDFPNSGFRSSSPAAAKTFHRELADAGYVVTVRRSRGADIAAACGQLRRAHEEVEHG